MPKIIPVENIENNVNKVTSLSGDLSDDQYPSAKAVKSALGQSVGKKTPEGGEIFNDYENNKAQGSNSTATGSNVKVSGNQTFGEGLNNTIINSDNSHIEGVDNEIHNSGGTHVEGTNNIANASNVHINGSDNRANHPNQTIIGKFNDNKSDTLFEIGNGEADNARSNAFEVKTNGSAELQEQGETDNSVVIKSYVDKAVDYIVEQGTTNGWTYRKWHSGVAECWFYGWVVINLAKNAEGNISGSGIDRLYVGHTELTTPVTFTNKELMVCTGSCNWQYTEWITVHATGRDTVQVRKFGNGNSFGYKNEALPDTHNQGVSVYVKGPYK